MKLFELKKKIENCKKCRLWKTRHNVVFGGGNLKAEIMFVGEAPGKNEDLLGRPFIGQSGKFLNKQLKAVGIKRKGVYITSIVKCRPPENRRPKPDEIKACLPYLKQQIKIINPKIICLLGNVAIKVLLGKNFSVTKDHGRKIKKNSMLFIPMPHPAAAMRFPKMRKVFIQDLKMLMKK